MNPSPTVMLAPLSDEEVVALVETRLGRPPGPALADHLRRAGGNPFFVVELVEALVRDGTLEHTQG